jgi:hypothetical protein
MWYYMIVSKEGSISFNLSLLSKRSIIVSFFPSIIWHIHSGKFVFHETLVCNMVISKLLHKQNNSRSHLIMVPSGSMLITCVLKLIHRNLLRPVWTNFFKSPKLMLSDRYYANCINNVIDKCWYIQNLSSIVNADE